MARILDFRDRFRFRRILYSKPMIIVMAIFVVILGRGAWSMHEKSVDAIKNRDKALEELQTLQARKTELDGDIAHLSSDRGVEEEIRDRFMVAKEGEKVMIVVAPPEDQVHTITVQNDQSPSLFDRMMGAVGLSGQ